MAQSDFTTKEAVTYVGLETSFGSTPATMVRAYPIAETVSFELSQTEQENDDESSLGYDYKAPVRGNKSAGVKFEYAMRPAGTRLSGANVPESTNPLHIVLDAVFGGSQYHSGSSVSGSATTGSCVLPSGHAARFAIGQWALLPSGSAFEPRRIVSASVSTDTIYWEPALPAVPAVNSTIVNMWNYYAPQRNTKTLTVQHGKVDNSNIQYTLNGCNGSVEVKVERDQIAKLAFDLKGASFTGPQNQSLDDSFGTDSMSVPIVVAGAKTWISPVSAPSSTQYPLMAYGIKINLGNEQVTEFGGVNGVTGMYRVPQRLFVELSLKFRYDISADTSWYANGTPISVSLLIPSKASVARWDVLDVPTGIICGKPVLDKENGRGVCTMTVRGMLNAFTPKVTELAIAPFVLAMG